MNRREYLAGAGLALSAAVAGCSVRSAGENDRLVDDGVRVAPDRHHRLGFELETATDVMVETAVTEGPPIDLLVMTGAQYDDYTAGEGVAFEEELSQTRTVGRTTRGRLSAGRYAVVVDNTTAVRAAPGDSPGSDVATVEVTATRE